MFKQSLHYTKKKQYVKGQMVQFSLNILKNVKLTFKTRFFFSKKKTFKVFGL